MTVNTLDIWKLYEQMSFKKEKHFSHIPIFVVIEKMKHLLSEGQEDKDWKEEVIFVSCFV